MYIVDKIVFGILGCLLLVFVAFFAVGLFLFVTRGVGFVQQNRSTYDVKEFIKEEGGCIYYISTWGYEAKTCGDYSVKKIK